MSENPQWHVMQGEEQLGPYTGEQLAEYASNGSILRETLVWAEGMENWLPASDIENLFPPLQAAAATGVASPVATGAALANPDVPPGTSPADAPPADGSYPAVSVKGASFGMWSGLLVGGTILIILALAGVASTADSTRDTASLVMILTGLGAIGFLLMLISTILGYIYLYRAWKCLEFGGYARTSPGKAIGFMFIPFFNLYWLFQGIGGLPKDWNNTVSAYQELQPAPRMSEGVFLTVCICTLVFPPVNLVMMFIIMSQICKGINFFAFRPVKHAGGPAGFTLG